MIAVSVLSAGLAVDVPVVVADPPTGFTDSVPVAAVDPTASFAGNERSDATDPPSGKAATEGGEGAAGGGADLEGHGRAHAP